MYEMRRLPTVTRVWPAAEVRAGQQVVDDVVLPRAASAYSPQTRPSLAAELLAEVRGHHEDPEAPPLMIFRSFIVCPEVGNQ